MQPHASAPTGCSFGRPSAFVPIGREDQRENLDHHASVPSNAFCWRRPFYRVAPRRTSGTAFHRIKSCWIMLTLLHHPFCPHSRFVRLALGEYGIDTKLVEERAWERREDFLILNPAGTTPVLIEEGHPPVPGASIIAEYLSETCGAMLGEHRLLPSDLGARVEVRRLAQWFNDKFFAEVSGPLVTERILKRHMRPEQGGGPPDTDAIRAALSNIRYHLAYIGWLARTRDWLAGPRLSYADLAA